jgi:hypothetical protein
MMNFILKLQKKYFLPLKNQSFFMSITLHFISTNDHSRVQVIFI